MFTINRDLGNLWNPRLEWCDRDVGEDLWQSVVVRRRRCQ